MINDKQIILESNAKNKKESLIEISKKAYELGIVIDQEKAYESFLEREKISSTGFENGVSIPHIHSDNVKKSNLIFIKFKNAIDWKSIDNSKTNFAIAILMSKKDDGNYLDVLSNLSMNLSKEENVNLLKTSNNKKELADKIKSFFTFKKASNVTKQENKKIIVGVSSCTTGVVHTYMCKEILESTGGELGYEVHIECQGQRGPEYKLKQEWIDKAEVVILAVDVAIEQDRFANKKVYSCGTREVVKDAKGVIARALQSNNKNNKNSNKNDVSFIENAAKGRPTIIKHLLCGVSYLIPFVVFAGLLFAINNGVAKSVFGSNFSFQKWPGINHITSADLKNNWHATRNLTDFKLVHILTIINSVANIGFALMIPFMGGYIAYSIAGRSAIAPAVITTFLLCNPSMDLWYNFHGTFNLTSDKGNSFKTPNAALFSWTLFGAIYAGFIEGYLVKWVLTWKVNKHIAPIMPIIIIPLFCTAVVAVPTAFLIAAPFGFIMGKFNYGLSYLGQRPQYGFLIGLILGAMVGFDLGGPINKTAVLVATSLMQTDGGHLMGAVAAAIPIAPLGCALTSTVFARKQFTEAERSLGVSAWSLGIMGITEGSIPFAARDSWRNIVANVIGSAIAGSLAFVFNVAGHVGAWGGIIIVIFGGVTNTANNYIGILWYLVAIAAGMFIQSFIYTSLLWKKEGKDNKFLIYIKNTKIYKKINFKKINFKKIKAYYNNHHKNGVKLKYLFDYKE